MMDFLRRLLNRDPYPTVEQYRRYLDGINQARPRTEMDDIADNLLNLSRVRVGEFWPTPFEQKERNMRAYRAAEAERRDESRNAPIVGVRMTLGADPEKMPKLPEDFK